MANTNTEEQKRLFKDWLQNNRKISQATLTSYTEDILSKLKEIIELSNNEKVKSLNPNMYSYQTKKEFDYFIKTIKSDPNFDIINKTGQISGGWVSTPLNHYEKFLVDNYKTNESINKDEINNMNIPLNQILYGPPGTGKTYNTVLKAMSIIDNNEYKDVSDEKYSELKTRFDELKQAGQIEFVTFHQSYSYEEFVEGIKPDLNADNLAYKLENGIFKNICKNSAKTTTDNFDEVYEKFINDLSEYNEDNLFTLKTGKEKTFGITVNSNKNLSIYMGKNLTKWATLTKENLKNLSNWNYYATPIYEYLKSNYNLSSQSIENSKKPHILIIDEINRGDVSKIFGELITLIEEDKRIGNKHQMKITLPYSKESFGVPNNLYIIGTMNTADRSIALLDTALRRRFDFEEIMPRPELLNNKVVEGINLQTLLIRINERITNKYDRDHQIGHSYLMGVNTKEQLERAYKNRILPLLNEYFYNESETVAEVLNCSKTELNQSDFITILTKAQNDNKK